MSGAEKLEGVRCQCTHPHCGAEFLTFSNLGLMCCPHCGALGPAIGPWGSLSITFVPEVEHPLELDAGGATVTAIAFRKTVPEGDPNP